MSVVPQVRVGGTVKFADDNHVYTVRVLSGRFAICTRPLPKAGHVMYTIIDTEREIRGPNDYVFNPYDYSLETQCEMSLRDLLSKNAAISRRREVPLVFEWIRSPGGTCLGR